MPVLPCHAEVFGDPQTFPCSRRRLLRRAAAVADRGSRPAPGTACDRQTAGDVGCRRRRLRLRLQSVLPSLLLQPAVLRRPLRSFLYLLGFGGARALVSLTRA